MSEQKDVIFVLTENRVSNALKAWHTPAGSKDNLLLDLLLVQEIQQNQSTSEHLALQRSATNEVLLTGIKELEQQHPNLAQVLRLRFVSKEKLRTVAYRMTISEQTVSRLQKKGIQQLAEIIQRREFAKRWQHFQQMEAALPPATYTRLFGVKGTSQQLLDLLKESRGPSVIALIGLGGIGKTALMDMVVRQIISHFHFQKVIWLRIIHQTLTGYSDNPELTFENLLIEMLAKLWPGQVETLSPQERLTKLRQELNHLPHLIVIDNIESQSDLAYILDQLHGFARPTKFLLTSRSRLTEHSSVYNIRLQELSLTDATDFVRYYAQECGLESVATALDEDIGKIYEFTGGNPLALKLVISLLDVLPLAEILADLTYSYTNSIEGMYRHIYQQSWASLSDSGRILLQAMPLVSENGGTAAYLGAVSGLAKEKLWPALQELHNRSLIEARGTIHKKRYGIHRLTHSFLCSDILQLPEWQSRAKNV